MSWSASARFARIATRFKRVAMFERVSGLPVAVANTKSCGLPWRASPCRRRARRGARARGRPRGRRRLRSWRRHGEASLGEVDLAPAQREQLADAQAGADRRGEQRVHPRVGHRLAATQSAHGCVEQRLDLLGFEPCALGLGGLEPAASPARGVELDVPVLDRQLKDLREQVKRLVDRALAGVALACSRRSGAHSLSGERAAHGAAHR